MNTIEQKEIWFITGSQNLYGEEALGKVAANSREIAKNLDASSYIPLDIRHKGIVKTSGEIKDIFLKANMDEDCIGVITWMHTFSPAKMWIQGLDLLKKPICHFHTQFNREIPWEDIDMDFMNLNQSAHGDREFGFMMSRMHKNRKVIVGHWKDKKVQKKLGRWSRSALGWNEIQNLKVARIGDNMREVAVTEGDKVSAQIKFGVTVNGYDSSDVTAHIDQVSNDEIDKLLQEYENEYELSKALQKGGDQRQSLIDSAKIELGLRAFLKEGGFKAFTDTFENLGEIKQLPGLAVQRLMADGYGFGAEGDWKTAALLRVMKVMGQGLEGGTSFMEDYTYHFKPNSSYILGSHMLEICPSITTQKPKCEVHPLGIGGKDDPVRLVFDSSTGPAINVSLMDIGDRFRFVVNEVESVQPEKESPNLPVARALWQPQPNFEIATTAWILAGGAHHTVHSQALTTGFIEDLAKIAGVELLVIDNETKLREFKEKLQHNAAYYKLFEHHS